jgi:hypothetical protein
MRYRLRTLLIALALGPPVLAALWYYAFDLSASARAMIGAVLLSVEIGIISLIVVALTVARLAATKR